MQEQGILSELKVCVYLLERHWEVYAGVNPLGSADLVIRRGDQTFFVEVKTGLLFGRQNLKKKDADLLAVVTKEGIKWRYFQDTYNWVNDLADIV